MNINNLIFGLIGILFLNLNGCQSSNVKPINIDSTECGNLDDSKDLVYFKNVDNENSSIEKQIFNYPDGSAHLVYRIKYPGAPAGYLGACNLPEEFKQDGLQIRFSGIIYIPVNIELKNVSSVTVKLSRIEKR